MFDTLYDVVPWLTLSWDIGCDPNVDSSHCTPQRLQIAFEHGQCVLGLQVRGDRARPRENGVVFLQFILGQTGAVGVGDGRVVLFNGNPVQTGPIGLGQSLGILSRISSVTALSVRVYLGVRIIGNRHAKVRPDADHVHGHRRRRQNFGRVNANRYHHEHERIYGTTHDEI